MWSYASDTLGNWVNINGGPGRAAFMEDDQELGQEKGGRIERHVLDDLVAEPVDDPGTSAAVPEFVRPALVRTAVRWGGPGR